MSDADPVPSRSDGIFERLRAAADEARVEISDGGAELRTASAGEMTAGFVSAPKGTDFRPLLDWDAVGNTRTEAEFFKLLDQMIGVVTG